MKFFIRFTMMFLAIMLLLSCGFSSSVLRQGSYIGVGQGNSGPIKVQVIIDKRHNIAEINVIEYCDTPGIGDTVFDNLSTKIIKTKSTQVDTVTGATYTSKGFLSAVKKALEKAK